VSDGAAHLARLGGLSRPTGSAACADARRYCGDVLAPLGFVIQEHSFEYSQFIGRWAAPAIGLVAGMAATLWYAAGSISASQALGIAVALAMATWAMPLRGVLRGRILRATGTNLFATRGEPRVWLVAHIDSKWQPVSMLVRVAGVLLLVVGIIAVIVSSTIGGSFGGPALIVAWIGALPLMLSVVGARNHGTLDNASGVAAVLEAAALIPPTCAIGIAITDAEELALAGATAWTRDAKPGIALNCDSVDDDGPLVVMYSGRSPREIISRLEQAATAHDEPMRIMRLIPGILTDHVPLAHAGWRTVTLSRGTIRTLQRIHTSRDTLAHMSGRGIAGAAQVLARAATELSQCK